MFAKRAAIPAAVVALVLGGCGEDSGSAEKKAKIERLVRDFAQADGREACDLMTVRALEDVYGLDDERPAYWNCIEASRGFEGQDVEIDDTDLGEGSGATVRASTEDDTRRYRVRVKRISGEWLIQDIVEE